MSRVGQKTFKVAAYKVATISSIQRYSTVEKSESPLPGTQIKKKITDQYTSAQSKITHPNSIKAFAFRIPSAQDVPYLYQSQFIT